MSPPRSEARARSAPVPREIDGGADAPITAHAPDEDLWVDEDADDAPQEGSTDGYHSVSDVPTSPTAPSPPWTPDVADKRRSSELVRPFARRPSSALGDGSVSPLMAPMPPPARPVRRRGSAREAAPPAHDDAAHLREPRSAPSVLAPWQSMRYALRVWLQRAPPAGDRADATDVPRSAARSLWDQLLDEVLTNSSDSTQELKWERVVNFMAVPVWVERFIWLGQWVCLNSFLYTVTILPLRCGVAWARWAYNLWVYWDSGQKRYLNVSNKCDILKAMLVIQTCYILARVADASKMYHSVRGQDVVKLSVIFSVLEIADRLCASFGQDALDSLFSRRTLARRDDGSQPYVRMLQYYVLCLAYVVFHTFVLLYQMVTLNVAINSYDNALLTLLLSNQFVEIKTTVFKRFEKEILLQLTCADVVERFQLSVILTAIGLRNLIEVSGATALGGASALGPLPTSFDVYPYVNVLFRTLNPVLAVLLSEVLVDWLKHAFITKANHIRPAIYGRYMDVLCRDILPASTAAAMDGQQQHQSMLVDQSPLATRRLGLSVLPLVCVAIRISFQVADMLWPTKDDLEVHRAARWWDRAMVGTSLVLLLVVAWLALLVLKIVLGVRLTQFATHRYASRHPRELEDQRNAKGRPPIGEVPLESAQRAHTADLINKKEDNAVAAGLYGTATTRTSAKESSLLDVQRYSLVGSRLW